MSLASSGGNKMVTSKNYIGRIDRTLDTRDLQCRATFKAGELFPIYCEEVYPATNKKVHQGSFIRSITPLGPVMDRSFLDVFYFFVPFRLVWDHWEEFIAGYNKEAWNQDVEYLTPQIKFKLPITEDENINEFIGSWCDHVPGLCDVVALKEAIMMFNTAMTGLTDEEKAAYVTAHEPLLAKEFGFSALYPRAMVKIWNDWFRDENLQDEYELYTGDNDEYADEFAFDLLHESAIPFSCKYHNRFTTCLPRPTKGPDVLIPMDNLSVDFPDGPKLQLSSTVSRNMVAVAGDGNSLSYNGTSLGSDANVKNITGGIARNVSNTIRMLRLATQTELLLARDARGGTRYVESLLSHWSTLNGDGRLQRAEYLGSRQIPLSVIQVTNTAQGESSPLGNVGGQSVTRDAGLMFNKAFSDYGVVIGLATVRTNLSYGSGRRKQFTRKGRFDYIWPEFKHVGDVELMVTELDQTPYLITEGDKTDRVLGFTPYGSELREGYHANTGLFRIRADGSYSHLTYQENFANDIVPSIGNSYIKQPSDVVANTLVDQTGPQFYALFEFTETQIIPLDPTSDPGLMDHF